MMDIYTQYEITKPRADGVAHRIAFMTAEMLAEWLADGWSVFRHFPHAKLVKNEKTNQLVEYQP